VTTATGVAGLVSSQEDSREGILDEGEGNLTISCSRPIGAAHRELATPPPPPEGREISPWKKEEELKPMYMYYE